MTPTEKARAAHDDLLVARLRAEIDLDELNSELHREGSRMTPELTPWLRAIADPTDQKLLDEILRYEERLDGEWGCSCDRDVIERGDCRDIDPDELTGVRLLALRYANSLGYQDGWAPR